MDIESQLTARNEIVRLLTAREVAAILRCSVSALYIGRSRGKNLPVAIRRGRALLYDPADVRAWIEQNRERREQ